MAIALLLTGCDKPPDIPDDGTEEIREILMFAETSAASSSEMTPITTEAKFEEADEEVSWTEEELQAIAQTLAGECYDDKTEDKRLVCEVILNRVSDGRFGGDTVIEVLTEENQFAGYWRQSRSISESDLEIAENALRDWYEGDCAPLSEYLFFFAGDNRENVFRSDY